MEVSSRTRNMLEGLVREGSFKWLLGSRSSFDDEFEEMERSPSAGRNWIQELSPLANIVVRRCSKILGISSSELQESFNAEASEAIKHPSRYARNFLEYCCFRTLALSTQVTGHLADKKFRRLTYDVMLAWEVPAASSQPLLNVDGDATVGMEAFSRIAPAVPIIANVVISENLFEVLTSSTGGRLQYSIFNKYITGLERAIKKMKTQSESSILSAIRSSRGEKILEVDGTVTTQPVLEHVGISTWPGRLTLTDHALYFEAHRVVSYEKAKIYDLAEDLKQVVKPELTGPWGTRLFDKAVFYKSVSLSEPIILEFPELKGHTRRDYWLAIIREILYAHRFINKFQITGVQRDEVLSKAVLGILRLQAIQEISTANSVRCESLLMFNLCDQLPGGDLILETLANMSNLRELERTNKSVGGVGMYSISAMAMVSNLGFVFGPSSSNNSIEAGAGLVVGEIAVGEMSPLERTVKESRNSYKKVVQAQETVDGVKVDGIDTNLAVMKELLLPAMEVGRWLLSLAYWDDPLKSSVFCLVFTFIICRGWLGYALALLLVFFAIFMVLTRFLNQGKPVDEVKVIAPPPMNTMEQLLAVQNAISQAEQLIQDGNIFLLKLRGLLLTIFPQASDKFAVGLLLTALILIFVPSKYIVLLMFLEIFTRYSPTRRASTERWMRRLREWWFSIPAAPVILERENEERKKK
ncbi:Heat-inducible transcription repressor [Citrus sinensis]|uniref:Heat-inducible transcription repressor n=1 Tax=Citrus sinensis TaxID=2711 RepID=A0ACB8LZ81_CITSI|nr:Heat-inducible transcription repressor [Citrus sinensis]